MVLITPAPADAGEAGEEAKKKSSLQEVTTTGAQLEGGRRLVEYFVVVSSVPRKHADDSATHNSQTVDSSVVVDDEEFVDDYDFQPQITARYPLHDHHGNPLHESVTFFCHPSGGIRLRTECTMPKVHYFAATGGTGQKMYGTCLTLWEPYMITAQQHHTKDDDDADNAEKQLEVFLPKCLVLLSTHPYLVAFREFLTQLNRLSKMGEMTLPLERYVVNFCSEIPAPPPGSFEVQTTILDSVIKIWSPPHNQPIAWVSLPFQHLFECLDIDNVILVWHCLMLERQVLLTSTQLSILTECSEILLSLLFPMRWSHAYIPLLPHFLIPILSAPMPFFCGINKANLADALCDLSRECVVVDLDKNLVTLGPDTEPMPPLPNQLKADLEEHLEDNVGMIFREARSLTKNDDYSERGIHLPNHVKLMAEAMWEGRLCLFDEAFHLMYTPEESRKNLLNGNDTSGMDMSERDGETIRILTAAEKQNMRKQSQWDAVQEAFVDAYVYLLRNYRKFLVFPSKEHEGSYGGAGFRSKEFVQTQRYDMQAFLQELIGTQMFDNFVTKRLYGSGEADVTFFDRAVDRFLKTQGLLSNSSLLSWRTTNTKQAAASASASNKKQNQGEPLLQSARVHRKLKTIVPPEPSGEGLPPHPLEANNADNDDGVVVTALTDDNAQDGDDSASVGSSSTSGTRSTSRSMGNRSPSKKNYKSIQDKAADILEKSKYRYAYPTFPSEFNAELFGTPRPLPSAVIAEFDRQRTDAARFRRKKAHGKSKKEPGHNRARTLSDAPEIPPHPEVSTFTLFFMAFSAMVGKELLDISDNPLLAADKTILATYTHPSEFESSESDSDAASVPTTEGTSTINTDAQEDEEFEDADEGEEVKVEEQPEATETTSDSGSIEAQTKTEDVQEEAEDEVSKDESEKFEEAHEEDAMPIGVSTNGVSKGEPRSRFSDSLSALQIEEAKATGRAQLALAFEMLTMTKKRGLKADPEAYQCLIDACGRVGDTQRATELLAKMHSDGIVADGVVYSCLVAAFSVESAWKQTTDAEQEELPEWANSTSIEMDWNKLQKQSFLDTAKKQLKSLAGNGEDNEDGDDNDSAAGSMTRYQKLRHRLSRRKDVKRPSLPPKLMENNQFYVTEAVEMQIELGENLLEIVYPDISVDTDNETCPRCNFLLSDDDVVAGWTPADSNDYTTSCPNCMQRFVPHFRVQSTSLAFMGSRGPASPLFCERLSPWVLQKEIRTVMSDREGIENLLDPEWREREGKNAVLWWNLILSCMRYRFPFSFLLQGSFEQSLIAPMPSETS